MTKKEQAELDRLKQELDEAKALRYPIEAKPRAVPVDGEIIQRDGLQIGWFQSNYETNFSTSKGCRNRVHHCAYDTKKTTTQTVGVMYHSRHDALLIARWEMTHRFAKALAKIDLEIEKELTDPTS